MDEIKLLLVDDETEFVKTLAERLKMRELDSEIALTGEEALEIVGRQPPDVMVLDLKMPGIDGMEVLRVIKKAHPHVQVVMLTGHGSEKDEKEARRLGAFDYLQKPVAMEKLVKIVKEAYSYKNNLEKTMMAATFAEAGEFETAKEMLDRDKEK